MCRKWRCQRLLCHLIILSDKQSAWHCRSVLLLSTRTLVLQIAACHATDIELSQSGLFCFLHDSSWIHSLSNVVQNGRTLAKLGRRKSTRIVDAEGFGGDGNGSIDFGKGARGEQTMANRNVFAMAIYSHTDFVMTQNASSTGIHRIVLTPKR